MEKLEFIDENGEKTQFYVIEETRINGIITCLYQSQIMRTMKQKLIFLRIHLMRQVKKLFMSL
mgnify:CR=1 FL=1